MSDDPFTHPPQAETREEYLERKQIESQKNLQRGYRKNQKELDEEEEALRRIVAVNGEDVEIRAPHWLWRDRYVLGGLSLLAGKGETAKSTVYACQTAWLTTGRMKGDFWGTPVNVAYVGNEDLLEETIKPRMVVHGADMSRVYFLKVHTPLGEDALSFPRDTERLETFIRENNIVATFIDPLSACVTGNRNDQGNMRMVFQHVSGIAQRTRTSINGLAHTRKEGAKDIIEALMGSVEQSNVARSVHGLITDPDEDGARILSCEKNNLRDKTKLEVFRFRLESVPVVSTDGTGEVSDHPRIKWLDPINETASDILGDAIFGHDGVDECARWLYDYLVSQGGKATLPDIKESAGKKWSEKMLQRARKKTLIKSVRARVQHSYAIWYLPSEGGGGDCPE